jgi:transcription elongation GreA/GreB family factor
MERKKLKELIVVLDSELEKSRRRMEETVGAANEIARASANSPSQSGDRDHSRNQAYLTEDSYNNLVTFKQKLLDSLKADVPETIKPICRTMVELEGAGEKELVVVDDVVKLPGVSIVTTNSPLGRVLVGKKRGESFEFESERGMVKGVITDVG